MLKIILFVPIYINNFTILTWLCVDYISITIYWCKYKVFKYKGSILEQRKQQFIQFKW